MNPQNKRLVPTLPARGTPPSRDLAQACFTDNRKRRRGSAGSSDSLGFLHQHFRLLDRGDVDQAAVERDGALAFLLSLLHGFQNLLRLADLLLARRKEFVGELYLARVDGPLTLTAEDRCAARLRPVAFLIPDIAKGSVHGPQAGGPCGDNHTRNGIVPHVAPVIVALARVVRVGQHTIKRVRAPDVGGPRPG